ncbi:MAG: MBL fold metallo-hydrolase [Phycisphaerae bacterium]|nr:FprA family A-type flavoprotein [Phycisphaerae bacterium]NIP53557.1 FprA family A-type flavoprotein [Phycisphaerae bacterium]NIS52521.1 FprA family A-type flavoprotein [Phycisphaerae bacterium]NIU07398.1 FprA family A-type flavoprotein [Phycisphaerae bacterium]NIU54983.1 MBL fold metallo-hydrolase [Phycisphaerae bacterium]
MRELKPGVYAVGAVDWDRRLFDELIPLPDGTSYNAYLVKGSEKTALLDTVDPTTVDVLIENLVEVGIDRIDYVVAHHGEQDHSGSIKDILTLYPDAKVVTNPKCKGMLIDLLDVEDDNFITVDDGQRLSLGDKTLQFVYIPWVHWPETMGTFLQEDKILFPCDFFGSHLATSSLFVDDEAVVYESAKRYYAEIMMPFRAAIKKNLEKIKALYIEMIAPSHGPVYDKPDFIINAYKDWVGDQVKNEVILPYVSMHDSTRKMVEYFVRALIERGITVRQFKLSATDIGKLAISLVDAATIVVGSPTVLTGAHPLAAYAAILANALRPKTRFASIIGSYGWGGRMVEQLTGLLPNLKVEILEPVIAKGHPKADDFAALDKLADQILSRHKEIGIAD